MPLILSTCGGGSRTGFISLLCGRQCVLAAAALKERGRSPGCAACAAPAGKALAALAAPPRCLTAYALGGSFGADPAASSNLI